MYRHKETVKKKDTTKIIFLYDGFLTYCNQKNPSKYQ